MTTDALERLIEAVESDSIKTVSAHAIKQATGKHCQMNFVSAFNGSLDAATALHEALLPGWDWSAHGNGQAFVWPPGTIDQQNLGSIEVDIEDAPARALLAAILRALQSVVG